MSIVADRTIPIGARLKPLASTSDHFAADAASPASVDVAVIGAGVIGLSIAWRLATRGLSVAVFDRGEAGGGTSLAATGMLAAAAEHEPGGDDLLPLALDSQRLWPDFRTALEAESGLSVDYRDHGTLVIALGRDEVERLRFRHEHHTRSGLATRWLSGVEVRKREPALRASVAAGIVCADDHQVDPRALVPALTCALRKQGGLLFENCAVTSLDMSGATITGVFTDAGLCRAGIVVLATGATPLDALLPGIDLPLRPLKGQALALRTSRRTGSLSHVVWTQDVHLAPKSDGRLIVGATMEEAGFDPAITAGGMLSLLDGVHRALPASEEMEIEAVWSGFRPTTDDDAPILGASGIPGLVIATGHHRNGILLAPGTATAIETLITTGTMPDTARPFALARFQRNATYTREIMGA